MSSLETNPSLKAVGQSVRIKSKMEAAKKLLKAADAEESKALKIKIKELADQETELFNTYAQENPTKDDKPEVKPKAKAKAKPKAKPRGRRPAAR